MTHRWRHKIKVQKTKGQWRHRVQSPIFPCYCKQVWLTFVCLPIFLLIRLCYHQKPPFQWNGMTDKTYQHSNPKPLNTRRFPVVVVVEWRTSSPSDNNWSSISIEAPSNPSSFVLDFPSSLSILDCYSCLSKPFTLPVDWLLNPYELVPSQIHYHTPSLPTSWDSFRHCVLLIALNKRITTVSFLSIRVESKIDHS